MFIFLVIPAVILLGVFLVLAPALIPAAIVALAVLACVRVGLHVYHRHSLGSHWPATPIPAPAPRSPGG